MADILIKNTDHWMDALSAEEVQSKINIEKADSTEEPPVSPFEISYKTRYQKGDVIEVAEDNRWHDQQHGNGKFVIIRAPFISLEEAKVYMESDENNWRRRYRMWFENLTEEQLNAYRVAENVYQINTVEELFHFSQDKIREPEVSVDN